MTSEKRPHGGSARIASRLSTTRRGSGFSLIEMLTTMSILAILLAIASPGLASLTSANSLSVAQGELTASLVLARSEAMRRGVAVGVAAATPTSGSEFTAGWNVFVDSNGNGRFDGGETIVRQEPALHGDLRVSLASGATAVIFNGRGFLTPATMLTFNLCAAAASKSYVVRVEPVGLADVSDGTAGCP